MLHLFYLYASLHGCQTVLHIKSSCKREAVKLGTLWQEQCLYKLPWFHWVSWSAFVAIFSLISEYKHECMAAYSLPQKLAAICNTHEQLSLSEPDSGQNNAVKWYIIWQIDIFDHHIQTQLKKCFLKVLFASQRLFEISYCLSRHMPCRVILDIIYDDFWWFYFIFTLAIVHMVWEIAFLGICLIVSYVLNFSVNFSDFIWISFQLKAIRYKKLPC